MPWQALFILLLYRRRDMQAIISKRCGASLPFLAVIALLGALSTPGQAAVTHIVEEGKLVGATGVMVNGAEYTVSFVDGTCIALFSGCDENSDFTFGTGGEALAATRALLSDVLRDIGVGSEYDTDPGLTRGCGDTVDRCLILTPFNVNEYGFKPARSFASNARGELGEDDWDAETMDPAADTGSDAARTWAVWAASPPAQVPLPAAAWLFGSGLVGLLGVGRRRKVLAD